MIILTVPDPSTTYLPILAVIITVLSVATFSFLLPKTYDHFNNKSYRNYKEMLDLRKALLDNDLSVDKYIDDSIKEYEKEFITNRQKRNQQKESFWMDAIGALSVIALTTGCIIFIATVFYQIFLDILPNLPVIQHYLFRALENIWYTALGLLVNFVKAKAHQSA